MASAISTCNSPEGHHEASDVDEASPPSSPICQCENQLAHWDWAGNPHPNLPKCCQPDAAFVTRLKTAHLQTAEDDGKISVQLLKK
jgi:hypothetical protein